MHKTIQAPCAVEQTAATPNNAGGAATPAVIPAPARHATQAALQAVWQIPQAIGPASAVPELRSKRTARNMVIFVGLKLILWLDF